MIRIEFPADRTDIAAAIGRALLDLGGASALNTPATKDLDAATPKNRMLTIKEHEEDVERMMRDALGAETETDPGIVRTDHIEATIPVSQGGTLIDTDNITIGPKPGSVFEDNGTLPQIDGKGVAFHAAFCGISAKPFYETGKTSGQWKKRRGVDQAAYDAWYAEQLANDSCESDTPVDTAPVDTAGAFNGDGAEPVHTHAPTTIGEYMGWVSTKQAAELLTQDDVNAAYATVGLQGVADLFPPNSDQVVADRVLQLHRELSAKAGA
jgi:hypothetical protein